jgi:hypothetical protein
VLACGHPQPASVFLSVILPLCLSHLIISWNLFTFFVLFITLSSLVEKLRFLCDYNLPLPSSLHIAISGVLRGVLCHTLTPHPHLTHTKPEPSPHLHSSDLFCSIKIDAQAKSRSDQRPVTSGFHLLEKTKN